MDPIQSSTGVETSLVLVQMFIFSEHNDMGCDGLERFNAVPHKISQATM